MGIPVLTSVDEYRRTVYRPDCDYVDGVVVERNVGERDHSIVQGALLAWMHARRRQLGIYVFPEQRVQVKATRFRVPDLCVTAGPKPDEQVFTKPPFLCVEILSPEDRTERVQERISDYLDLGVRFVWLISPEARKAWVYTPDRFYEVKDGKLRTEGPDIEVPLEEIFSEL
jgi:Uma2 family endonuclease